MIEASTLFPNLEPPVEVAAPPPVGPFAGVALEQSIDRVLDYSIPPRLQSSLQVGQRVRVPLGRKNRPAHGYVIYIRETTDHPQTKAVFEIEDARVLVPPSLMELARWIGRYYVSPLGTVLESVIPSAVKRKVGIGYTNVVYLKLPREQVQEVFEKTKAPKRRAVLARLLQLEHEQGIELVRLAGEAGVKPPSIRKLATAGVISIRPEIDLPRLTEDMPASSGSEADIQFNEDQQKAFDALLPRVSDGGFSVNLLHGVTGSGKTEVYLQCIREVVARGRQALVLVPEIALTPQTVRRFMSRFKSVAILHSGLSATQRHKYWQQISNGKADVVVGARSAIFAPLPNLGMIVVDEEHESSYKQDTAPRYHARDVAIKRGQIEDVPVLLGSATPSLESYWRVTQGSAFRVQGSGNTGGGADGASPRSAPSSPSSPEPRPLNPEPSREPSSRPLYLPLPTRVRGLQMPAVELIDMGQEQRLRRGVHLISRRLEHLLKLTIEQGHQAIILLNRRGYSNFVYCSSCTNVIQCKYCDTTMTYHRSAEEKVGSARFEEGLHTGQLHCHYCLAVNKLPGKCPSCGKKLTLFGLGTQRVEEELAKKFPDLKFARVDSDTMRSSKDYEALLGRFAKGEVQVMLGTQMIAKGLDYPNVTLVGVISGDTALALPDFRAAERTFQLITQVAGRAGRGDAAGRVVLQTFLPNDPTIVAALKHDFTSFAKTELKSRREVGLPPFARMVRVILRDQEPAKLQKHSDELAAELSEAIAAQGGQVRMKGPMPCPISRIAGYFRNQIVLTAPTAEPLQKVLAAVRKGGSLTKAERVAVDVDPVSLL